MLRPLRALVALALLVAPMADAGLVAGADDREVPGAIANNARRQALLHRHWPSDGVPGSILLTAATPAAAVDIAAREGGRVVGDRSVLLGVEPGTESAEAARIAARGGVIGAEPDRVRQPAQVPNDPRFTNQWSHVVANAATAWDTTTGDPSVQVAVLDTGVDGGHTDLIDNLVEQVDLSSGRVVRRAIGSDNDTCDVGHGTLVAGVIGALGNNGTGVSGVAWNVSIVDVALTSRASRCGILDSAIIDGLEHVTDDDRPRGAVDVVNLSLGGIAESCPTALQAAIDDARDAGTLVVAAAGNEQEYIDVPISVPASCDGVVSVGAVGDSGDVAVYSNINEHVDLVAPGGDSSVGSGILTTAAGNRYEEIEGTSFAAPYVAGVAALMRSVNPGLSPDGLESILERTARPKGAPGRDSQYGWGLVDASAAVAAALAGDPGDPEPDPGFPVRAGTSLLERVAPPGASTEPVTQAVALSQFAFEPRQAVHAVVARSDDFADALAGSSLGYGIGPLLFTASTGALAGATRTELQRVLEPRRVVYLLGGTAALPATLEREISDLGFTPVRVAGVTRQETAVAVARALAQMLNANGFVAPDIAIVATAYNWPDAVTVGGMGAWFGLPILVTSPTQLDAPVKSYLESRDWAAVYVVGGTAAISDDVRRAIRDAARVTSGNTIRLAGEHRSGTAVAIGREFEALFSAQFAIAFGAPAVPNVVAGVNVRRADGFAHVLSASAIVGGFAGVFLPIEGTGGTEIDPEAQFYVCRFPAFGFVVGREDLVSAPAAELMEDLMQGTAAAC